MALKDGSLLPVQNWKTSAGLTQLTLRQNVALETDTASLLDAVTLLQPVSPRVRYLSDVENPSYVHIPFLTLHWPHWEDRSVLGGRLRHDGSIYLKGLGMHSTSRLAYDLPPGYRRFEAEVAVDEDADTGGSVTFRVFLAGDGGQWNQAYRSPVVRGGERPLRLRIELGEARRIALIVDFADYGDQLDHADWLNARLVK